MIKNFIQVQTQVKRKGRKGVILVKIEWKRQLKYNV